MNNTSRNIRSALLRYAVSAAIMILVGGATHKIHASDQRADLVLRNGAVYTVDASRSWASSVAVSGNRIQYVGNDTDVKSYIGPNTQIIELEGRMLLPGFQDSHVHSQSAAHSETGILRLDDIDDMVFVSERIREYAKGHPELPWLEGAGLDEDKFLAAVKNPRQYLDELVPDRPIVIQSMLIFTSWANSRAIEAGGITAETPDPPNGSIVRDPETGEPNGTFLNRAINLVNSVQPEPSPEQILADYRHALSKFSTHGITAIMEASAGPTFSVEQLSNLVYADEIKRRPGWVVRSLLHQQISRLQRPLPGI